MERHEILDMMGELKLAGMRLAFDEVIANGLKRQHPVSQIIGELLKAEIAEKHARSIHYQLGIAKLPLAKDLAEFEFVGAPINEALIRDLATGTFLGQQRNAVLVGGTGTGKTHLAIAIARSCIRGGARGRFSTSSISSIVSRPRRVLADRAAPPIISPASTSSASMSSAICPSRNPAVSFSSISSAASTSRPRSSSPPTSPSASGPPSSATPK